MTNIILPDRYLTGFFEGNLAWNNGNPTTKERTVEHYELEYITRDGNLAYIDDKEYPIIKDNLFIATPGQKRHTDLPFVCLYIKFDATGFIKEQCDLFPTCMPIIHTAEIEELFKKVIFSNSKDSIYVTASHFFRLLNKLLKELTLFNNSVTYNTNSEILDIVSNAKNYISQNYTEHINLKDIAASVNLSASYLHSLYTKNEGLTPHNYLTKKRIDAAKDMLLTQQSLSMSDIAAKCGFENQSYFNYVFKKETGMTPTEYKKISNKNCFK